ncbi:putative holin-like toxin [Virgibacillus saliphilus]|nr:putative holin-like toxin [Virgibacillus sp. NKC19-3]
MTVFEALMLAITFGSLIIAILSLEQKNNHRKASCF